MIDLSTSSTDPTTCLTRLRRKRRITSADVATLRGTELGLGVRTFAEAEAIMALDRYDAPKCREWGDFLVETMLDYLVWDERPAGRLTETRARWLCDRIAERPSPACMALLVAILDEAAEVPAWFPPTVQRHARNLFANRTDAEQHAAA